MSGPIRCFLPCIAASDIPDIARASISAALAIWICQGLRPRELGVPARSRLLPQARPDGSPSDSPISALELAQPTDVSSRYWRMGQNHLAAMRLVRRTSRLSATIPPCPARFLAVRRQFHEGAHVVLQLGLQIPGLWVASRRNTNRPMPRAAHQKFRMSVHHAHYGCSSVAAVAGHQIRAALCPPARVLLIRCWDERKEAA